MATDPVTAHGRVVAVVVAYNRRDLLRECLDGLAAQTRPVDAVIVVDNASDDDSAAVAEGHPIDAEVIRLSRNTGGSGGFAVGLARAAVRHGADAVWLMDDDTVPRPSALEQLLSAAEALGDAILLASRAVWTDGITEHPMTRPRRRLGTRPRPLEAGLGVVRVRSASFVSLLISGAAVRSHALPVADYFIWNDDFEYSSRLLRTARGYYCTRSEVVHKTRVLGATDADPGDRFFYEVRNKLWLFRWSRALGLGERVLYAGATVRRWIRTIARSSDRSRLLAVGGRGMRAALAGRPRATAAGREGAGVDLDDVLAIDPR